MVKNHSAYYKLHKKTKKLTCVIVRDNGHHNHFQDSQPCIYCQKLLKKMNFKKIIYTKSDGSIEIKKPRELNSQHYSRAQRETMKTVKNNKKK